MEAVIPTFLTRAYQTGMTVIRSLLAGRLAGFIAGSDYVPGAPVQSSYDPLSAMSAAAAFPWVRACVQAIAMDLSGIPLVAEGVDTHPTLDLIKRPRPGVPGVLFRRQIVVDVTLTGNGWVFIDAATSKTGKILGSVVLRRLHPARVKAQFLDNGDFDGVIFDGCWRYPASQVLWIRDTSWADGPIGEMGTGAIESLHNDLTADAAASKMTAMAAANGRPMGIVSPAEKGQPMTRSQTNELARDLKAAFKDANGGTAVFGDPLHFEALSWTPRDMEFGAQRAYTRDSVLAAFDVPPTRVGLPMANYATANQQERAYWQSLRGRAALYDAAWSDLADRMGKPADITHEFSGVSALQTDEDARLGRVVSWVNLLNADPTEAAEYEGLHDSPARAVMALGAPTIADGTAPVVDAGAPVADTALNGAQVAALIQILAAIQAGTLDPAAATIVLTSAFPSISAVNAQAMVHAQAKLPAPTAPADPTVPAKTAEGNAPIDTSGADNGAEKRAAVWKSWATNLHTPVTQALAKTLMLYHSQRRTLLIAAVQERWERSVPVDGSLNREDDSLLASLIDDTAMREKLTRLLGPRITQILRLAFTATIRELGAAIGWNPDRKTTILADLVTRVSDTTRDELAKILTTARDESWSTAQTVAELNRSPALGGARSLTIARTESTRTLNAGSVMAVNAANDEGLVVHREWVTARDGEVRDDHIALDGQVVGPGEKFRSGIHTADCPGDFGVAALDCNCRCTVIPKVIEEPTP